MVAAVVTKLHRKGLLQGAGLMTFTDSKQAIKLITINSATLRLKHVPRAKNAAADSLA